MPDFGTELLTINKAGAVSAAAIPQTVTVPFEADLANVSLNAGTAPTGANLVVDILKNGTSVYTSVTVATVSSASSTAQGASTTGVSSTDTSWRVLPAAGGLSHGLEQNAVLLCGTEMVQVTNVQGSSFVEQQTGSGSVGDVVLTVTRGYGGTTAAAHAAAAAITVAKPCIVAAASSSGTARFPAGPAATGVTEQGGTTSPTSTTNALFQPGDTIQASVTQIGSSVAGSDLEVVIELVQR